MGSSSNHMCLTCKGGRLLCGLSYCPLLSKIKNKAPIQEKLSKNMFGPSPSVFIGWHGWPQVNAGPLTALNEEAPQLYDDPGKWYGLGFEEIIGMRSQLVRSKQKISVRSKDRFIKDNQEIALSVKPVDVEAIFKKKPSFDVSFSPISQPMGPSGELVKLDVAGNPSIPRKVDYIVSDELRAADMMSALFEKEYDVYYLTNILASGALGMEGGRKLVPTRWSITAVDDILGKHLMEHVRAYPSVNEFQVYSNTYLENHFEVLVMPGAWEFELFEAWAPKTLWTGDSQEPYIAVEYEKHSGRWDYALNEGGGYYAGRFAVAEAMDEMRRQGRIVVFREIYEGYVVPVGVWEVRENIRHAMQGKAEKFSTLSEALGNISAKLRFPIKNYVEKSDILRQRRLTDYL